jgi:ABC-2 type transport system ATP-binding protein
LIEVTNLTKRFRKKVAVENISFTLAKGEILGFLGPNGAGKTTTMRMLTGFMPATEGTARICGFDVFQHPHEVKKRVGYLPENPPLYREMTTQEYLQFISAIKGMPRKEGRRRIEEVIDQLSLQEVRHLIMAKLSKGFRQRVGLAQALLHRPEVLILDEPTSGLDPKQVVEVRKLVKDLAGNHTIILSTHILPEVSMTCQRVIIIDKGRVIAVDTPENLKNQIAGSEKLLVQVAGPTDEMAAAFSQIPGVAHVVSRELTGTDPQKTLFQIESNPGCDVRDELVPLIVQRKWKLYELKTEGMSLEEIFIRLITHEEEAQTQ